MDTLRIYSKKMHTAMEVDGVRIRVFGIHKPLSRANDSWWVLTHLPTGHALDMFRRQKDAIAVARELKSEAWAAPEWVFGDELVGRRRPMPEHETEARKEYAAVRAQHRDEILKAHWA